jgi:uncharacterized DUF497 family protein
MAVARPFQYRFEWDNSKARQNLRKHRIAFERAATIFHDPDALSEFDEPHSDQEERWITMGLDGTGTVLVACHTFNETGDNSATVRLISARKATKNEMKQYRRA